jgi:hypothetical protein
VEVTLVQGTSYSVRLVGDSNLLPKISTEVDYSDVKLVISLDGSVPLAPSKPIQILVTAPPVSYIVLNSTGRFSLGSPYNVGKDRDINIWKYSSVNMALNVNARRLFINYFRQATLDVSRVGWGSTLLLAGCTSRSTGQHQFRSLYKDEGNVALFGVCYSLSSEGDDYLARYKRVLIGFGPEPHQANIEVV